MMLKHALVVTMAAVLMIGSSGCTSKKATDEDDTADVAEVAGEGDGLEDGSGGGDDIAATDSGDLGSDELSPDEQLPEDGGGASDLAANDGSDDFATPAEELADTPQANDMAASEPGSEPTPEPTQEPTPEPSIMGGVDETMPVSDAPMEEEPKKILPLRKIADAPYEQNGILVNAVYLARKGDTLDSITSRIYGTGDRKKELVKLNPMFRNRDAKVGDKVYYNSPQRPTDNSKLLTYYEDIGLAPETYAVNKPENIRQIAKNLLGDTNSWKELWSTNLDLESKGELNEGTQLRYWAGTPAPTMAQNDTAPPPMGMDQPPMDQNAAAPVEQAPPPPPPMDQPMGDMAMNEPPMDAPPPMEMAPPPPPTDLPPPPPPPPPVQDMASNQSNDGTGAGTMENPDQTMAMGAGAILLLGAVAIFILIRKRKARRQIDFHTSTQTQIE